ncbi:MAG TPA: c-type cytochrome [Candidatus Binataceae bacterium]|nr:c-type cytochrome [Candidatus Binataceae bacterium]
MPATLLLGLAMGGLLATACKPRELTPEQRGEVIYRTNCASCHGHDPAVPGPIGPAIAGSSGALIEARVLHRAYPPGYHPQRKTHLMLPMPWLAGHIGDLSAYLDARATDSRK